MKLSGLSGPCRSTSPIPGLRVLAMPGKSTPTPFGFLNRSALLTHMQVKKALKLVTGELKARYNLGRNAVNTVYDFLIFRCVGYYWIFECSFQGNYGSELNV